MHISVFLKKALPIKIDFKVPGQPKGNSVKCTVSNHLTCNLEVPD